VIYVPINNAYDNGNTPYATFSYTATAATSGLTSNSAGVTVYVNHTFPNPTFTGLTEYIIEDTTNLTMLLSGSSAANSYSIVVIKSIPSTTGVLYTQYVLYLYLIDKYFFTDSLQ
jgi:hypothetical protein